ncbi:hypothetical protein GQ54DRAFT_312989 [Martensiomyces pterosporus]|nr:hypothetical protein GQ54DRAFT_312989 [Martensiomyces pterosporus]
MLAFAANRHASAVVAAKATKQRIIKAARAGYQTHSAHGSPLGRGPRSGSSWISRLLAYLRGGANAVANSASKAGSGGAFSKTAAGRLRAAMPRGPAGWLARLSGRAPALAKPTSAARLGARGYLRSIGQLLSQHFRGGSGASRWAGRRLDPSRWAFGPGGRWSPYARIFVQSFSSLSAQHNFASARVIAAQIQRQTMAGVMTQQRRDPSLVLPFAHETRIRLLPTEDTMGADGQGTAPRSNATAAQKLAARRTAERDTGSHAATDVPGLSAGKGQRLHPAAVSAQAAAAIPVEQCVTIAVPYVISAVSQLPAGQHASSADVAQHLAEAQKLQQRHALVLSRLLERIAATGWSVQYQHVSSPVDGILIAVAPSSGIHTAAELESLLCDWGIDVSALAATVSNPRVSPTADNTASPPKMPSKDRTPSRPSAELTSISSQEFDDIDSRLFSLIVDEVVDPEEAYREEVRDFLAELERMPHISLRKPAGSPLATAPVQHQDRRIHM